MAMQRVSELDAEPEVGKFYLVPCIKDRSPRGLYVPILGPEHEDADYIEFPHLHYHSDLRFLHDRDIEHIVRFYAEGRLGCSREEFALTVVNRPERYFEPVERKVKCRRAMPAFPLSKMTWIKELERVYKKNQLASCLKCPHRGMELKNLPKDEQGNVVCNGHGLKWNLKTKQLVSRLTEG